jgi:aspartate aminotransferase
METSHMELSDRICAIEPSKTSRFIPLLAELKAQGREIINLAVGEPEYETAAAIIAATQRALNEGNTRYSDVPGLYALRQSLARRFDGYRAENIIVSNGAKQCLYSIFQVICNPADEIILPVPCWVSFTEQIKLAGARPVFVPLNAHQLDVARIEKALTARTRAILINSPHNPTGAVFARQDVAAIVELALARNLYLIADEAYARFVYDGRPFPSLFDWEHIRERLIVVRTFSKHHNMTGFRIGYAAAAKPIIDAMTRLQSHLSGNVCTFVQHGALSALGMDNGPFALQLKDLEKKRDLAFAQASQLFECIKPQGAFYIFPKIDRHLKAGRSSQDFAADLLLKSGVAVVPGEDFGAAGHLRISFAVAEEQLIRGFEKIKEVL